MRVVLENEENSENKFTLQVNDVSSPIAALRLQKVFVRSALDYGIHISGVQSTIACVFAELSLLLKDVDLSFAEGRERQFLEGLKALTPEDNDPCYVDVKSFVSKEVMDEYAEVQEIISMMRERRNGK